MDDASLVVDLVITLGAALLGGLVARRLRLPVLLGFLVAGVLVGPNTPGLTANVGRVQVLANLGVTFLMFAIGVEFSFGEFRRMRRAALIAGGIQLPLTLLLGVLVGWALGWPLGATLLLGGAFVISSSIVALTLLLGGGEATSPHARAALSLGMIQDLSLVVMLALLPLLTGDTDDLVGRLLRSLATAGLALGAVIILGPRVVPRILFTVAQVRSRELFLLTVVGIVLSTALASAAAGLSLALGAFLAGLVVAESDYSSHILAEIIPLRDLFAPLFFVSLGMLIEPANLIADAGLVLGVIGVLVVGKILIIGGAFLAAGLDYRTAGLAAMAMAQIGEFSFVLAGAGLDQGVIDHDRYGLILTVALGSIFLTPVLLANREPLVAIAARLPGVADHETSRSVSEDTREPSAGHVLICGHGRVGSELGSALTAQGVAYTVIDINPAVVRDLRRQGIIAFYGDAGAEAVLLRAGIDRAETLAVAIEDLLAAQAAVHAARRLNPAIDVVTRARTGEEVRALRQAGANEVVQPEFEAGLEFTRHVLQRMGTSDEATMRIVAARRADFYGLPHDDRPLP